jgi:hypothetical protein
VNIIASKIANIKPLYALDLLPLIKEWWAYVTVNPEDNNTIVFSNGNSKESIDSIPKGGHIIPNSIEGERAVWKKVQKIATKNKTSDTINNPIPIVIPLWTAEVWFPKNVLSDIISRNQNDIDNINDIILKNKLIFPFSNKWKDKTIDIVTFNKDIDVYNGQGDGETIWKGCFCILLKSNI